MPNSSFIRITKTQIMSDLQNDDEIIEALGLNEGEDAEDLIKNRFFGFLYVPKTQEEVKTYVLVEIYLPEQRQRYGQSSHNLVYPLIQFRVLAHQDDMDLDLAGLSAVRTDYIAELIDRKYNGKDGFGLKQLEVIENIAGSLDTTYKYRDIIFKAADFNDSYCE